MKLTQQAQYRLAIAIAIFVVAVWGETFISSKILLDNGMAPAEIFFLRFLLAYIFMWMFRPKAKVWANSLKDELWMMLLGITGGSLYFMVENTALSLSTASNVAIIVCSVPLVTAALAACFYKDERMNKTQIIGSVIAFLGMVLVVFNGEIILKLNPVGDLLAFGASLTWGIYSIVTRQVINTYKITFITRKVFAYGLITIIPYFIFVQPFEFDLKRLTSPVILVNTIYLGMVASMLCFIVWNWALKKIGTVTTTNLLYCQTFFTMLIANIFLGERITWMAVVGTIILTLGMILALNKNRSLDC